MNDLQKIYSQKPKQILVLDCVYLENKRIELEQALYNARRDIDVLTIKNSTLTNKGLSREVVITKLLDVVVNLR